MLEREEISRVVECLTTQYVREHRLESRERINSGYCYEFARDLAKELRDGAEVWEGPGHGFVKCSGLFFDSETPEGVEDWRDLSSFVRWGSAEDYILAGDAHPKDREEEGHEMP